LSKKIKGGNSEGLIPGAEHIIMIIHDQGWCGFDKEPTNDDATLHSEESLVRVPSEASSLQLHSPMLLLSGLVLLIVFNQ